MAGAAAAASICVPSFKGNCKTSSSPSWLVLDNQRGGAQFPSGRIRTIRYPGVRAEVKFMNSEEAKNLIVVEGYAILDIRDKSQFDRSHIKSCYHVPPFIENQDNDLGTIIKRTVHNNFSGLFFGLPFTKINPEFLQSIRTQFPPESKLLIVCQEGLTSAAAAQKLGTAGFQNIACITPGLQSINPGTFDSVGTTDGVKRCGKSWAGHHSREDRCGSGDGVDIPSREAASVGPHKPMPIQSTGPNFSLSLLPKEVNNHCLTSLMLLGTFKTG